MILVYHSVVQKSDNDLEVSIETFERQIKGLIKSGYRFVYLDDYDYKNPKHIVLRFDDGYKSVLSNAFPILKRYKLPFEIFVNWCFIEKVKIFKKNSKHLNIFDLIKLVKFGGRLQYHGKNHCDLSKNYDVDFLKKEIIPNKILKLVDKNGFKYFAYPFGKEGGARAKEIIKRRYDGAIVIGIKEEDGFCYGSIGMKEDTCLNDICNLRG